MSAARLRKDVDELNVPLEMKIRIELFLCNSYHKDWQYTNLMEIFRELTNTKIETDKKIELPRF